MVSLTQTPEEVLYDNVSNGELPRGPLQTLLDEMVAGINANEGGVTLPSEAVTGNGDVEAADAGRLFRVTSTATLSPLAAATAGAGYFFRVWADGAAATIDPNASETIEGGATLVIADGDAALVYTDGTTWSALVSPTSGKLGNAALVDVIDEDDMASDSETRPPSQQSVKAYVDNNAGGGEWVKIGSTTTLSNDATADFTLDTATYKRFQLRFRHVIPATDAAQLLVQMSPDAGSTIRTTGYKFNLLIQVTAYAVTNAFRLSHSTGSAAGEMGFSGDLLLQNVGAAGEKTVAMLLGGYEHYSNDAIYVVNAAGLYDTAEAHNLARVSFSSGNLESGEIELWGSVQ